MNNDLKKCLLSCLIWISIVIFLVIHIELTKTLTKPSYLEVIAPHQQRFIATEIAVFKELRNEGRERTEFVSWFNTLSGQQKRGFILFVRSAALSSLLGTEIHFSEQQWLSGRSKETAALTRELLQGVDLVDLKSEYEAVSAISESQREVFLDNNKWLISYLGENFSDFEQGLFYFFAEHSILNNDVLSKSHQFSELKNVIRLVSDAIISNRNENSRISPKEKVSDSQLREIVAGAFLVELVYGIPADFMLLITAYETNFAMEYWYGGYGTTQQTMRAANTVLQSEFWINRVYESSGAKIRYQLVTISALDNVFLCIVEAAKTIAIKAAELRIRTDEISPAKRVQFRGKRFPATWATAYKYNGSKRYANRYAGSVHEYYKKREWWLKSFTDI